LTKQEKKLLYIALSIFIFYAVPFEIYPKSIQYYQTWQKKISKLEREIDQYKKLDNRHEYWKTTHKQIITKVNDIENSLLKGETRQIVSGRLRDNIQDVAQVTGVKIKSFELAEFAKTSQWLLITQTLAFEANSAQIMSFLQNFNNSQILIKVVNLEIRSSRRNMLRGNVSITGFSHLLNDE
jgi:hypothetical protein